VYLDAAEGEHGGLEAAVVGAPVPAAAVDQPVHLVSEGFHVAGGDELLQQQTRVVAELGAAAGAEEGQRRAVAVQHCGVPVQD
jgi:hypothetical protein